MFCGQFDNFTFKAIFNYVRTFVNRIRVIQLTEQVSKCRKCRFVFTTTIIVPKYGHNDIMSLFPYFGTILVVVKTKKALKCGTHFMTSIHAKTNKIVSARNTTITDHIPTQDTTSNPIFLSKMIWFQKEHYHMTSGLGVK